jgi:hypothetical protein
MTSNPDLGRVADHKDSPQVAAREDAKPFASEKHLEHVDLVDGDLVYNDAEHEPELHIRTWVALASMCLFNYVIVFALLSPPAVASGPPPGFDMAALTHLADLIYRSKPRRHECPNMGAELTHAASGRPSPFIFLSIRCFSGPQGGYYLYDRRLFHWFGHCTWLAEYIPAHRRPNPNFVWIFGCSFGLRDSQRNIAEEVEAE